MCRCGKEPEPEKEKEGVVVCRFGAMPDRSDWALPFFGEGGDGVENNGLKENAEGSITCVLTVR